jgi:hypothetical protein
MFKDRPWEVPEHSQQELTGREVRLGFFGRRRCLLPLHTPQFGFWFLMMNTGFITSDNVIQEVITCMDAQVQTTTADLLAVALMTFGQKFGHIP